MSKPRIKKVATERGSVWVCYGDGGIGWHSPSPRSAYESYLSRIEIDNLSSARIKNPADGIKIRDPALQYLYTGCTVSVVLFIISLAWGFL